MMDIQTDPSTERRGLLSAVVRRGLSRTLVAWFLLLALVPLFLVSGISYQQAKASLRQSAFESLQASTALKTAFIENWFSYRFLDLDVQATSVANARFLNELQQAFKASGKNVGEFVGSYTWAMVVDEHAADIKSFRQTYNYYDVFLIDVDGNILFSVAGESDMGTNLFSGPYSHTLFAKACKSCLSTGRPTFSDFEFYAPSDNAAAGFLASPILDDGGDVMGLVVLQIPVDEIDGIMQNRVGLGTSGESYLVGSGGFMRSNLVLSERDTALRKLIDTEQTKKWREEHIGEKAQANAGMREENFVYAGPSGQRVLGIHKNIKIADVSWALIAEIEEREAFAASNRLRRIVSMLAIATVLIVLALSVSVARRIVRPLLDLSAATRRVATGKYDQDIHVEARNEIGTLGTAFNAMVKSLRENREENLLTEWYQAGQMELNETMRGNQNLPELCSNTITFLAKYLDAKIGAIYIANGDKRLELSGSYAFSISENRSNVFEFGQGLVGQAALEKERILLTQVPDDYIALRSGLGEAAPRTIVIKPFVRDGRVMGVIELGTLNSFSDRSLEFLDLVSESIAIGVQTLLGHARVQELLEGSQAQAEELQAREEELRENNDRLEAQSKSLIESEVQLQAQQEELRQTNEELEEQQERVEHQNVELQETQQQLEERASELELTSRYKSEFLANMSHELRTPLNSLLILSQVLAANKEGNLTGKQIESVEAIHGGGKDLLTLINDILDLSKVEAGKVEFIIESVCPKDLAESVGRQFHYVSQEHDFDFRVEVGESVPPIIHTDRQRIAQILKNLLSNAFKFTKQGAVTLRLDRPAVTAVFSRTDLRPESSLAFSVVDTGVGIPADKQSQIFEAFKQADGTTSREYGGTGLGLSICREFAAALGGEIHLDSQEGKGSTFTLFLPESCDDMKQDTGEAISRIVAPSMPEGEPETPHAPPGKADQPRQLDSVRDDRCDIQPGDKSLLIIEDDAAFAKVLADLAREKGFKCLIAGEGETGLHLADYYHPSAIILDIGLPGMDGWAVMNRLKENPETRHIPVHFMSAMDESRDALEMGAVGYLMKPLDVTQLEQAFATIEGTVGKPVKDLLVAAADKAAGQKIADIVGNGDVKCTVATSGEEAFDQLKTGRFDCVVIHPPLNDMTGTDLLSKMEACQAIDRIPVVVYSGEDLSAADEADMARHAEKMTVHTVRSPERLLDETVLFLHRVEAKLPKTQHNMLKMVHDKESILKGKKILLVDDEMRNVFALSAALEGKGLSIVVAKNGREALERLDEHPDIDLVLMDIMMPEMDGYEATAEIRRHRHFEKLPIIALTAKAMKGDRQKCIACGASDYLSKPVDLDKLTSLLRVWLYR